MNNCKVGIFTYHWPANFGANLQAVCMYILVKKFVNDVEIINFKNQTLVDYYEKKVGKSVLDSHMHFVQKYSKVSERVNELQSIKDRYSKIIVGSDSPLRIIPRGETTDLHYPNEFWLNWVGDNTEKTIFAASSMGSNYYSLPLKTKFKLLSNLQKFSQIYVRDRWTKWMLNCVSPFCVDDIVVDPTLIVDTQELTALFQKEASRLNKPDTPYILLCQHKGSIGSATMEKILEYCCENSFTLIEITHPDTTPVYEKHCMSIKISSVEHWLYILANSDGYIGEKFHPLAISLAFGKPVIALDNYANTRLSSFGIHWQSKIYNLMWSLKSRDSYVPQNKNSIEFDPYKHFSNPSITNIGVIAMREHSIRMLKGILK